MKAIGYARCSTLDQAEKTSLDVQRAAISQAAKQRDIVLGEVVEDAGASAKNMKRPGLNRVFSMLETGEADTLIVAKLDRFTRSLSDLASTLNLFDKRGWTLIALDMGIDMTTDTGRLMAHIMGSFAEYERKIISRRTKEGLAQTRANGVQLGRRSKISAGCRLLMTTMRKEGRSWQQIADHMTQAGVHTPSGTTQWSPSTVRYVCKQEAGAS
jgi:DNA invertase Pin-like site-specific DNA recombinase